MNSTHCIKRWGGFIAKLENVGRKKYRRKVGEGTILRGGKLWLG